MATLRYIACLVFLYCTSALAQTPGGTAIVNEATVNYSVLGLDGTTTSNEVESSVPSLCTFAVTPNGSVISPAYVRDAVAGTTVYFPYTLGYTGNIVTDIELTPLVELSSPLLPDNVAVILDSNTNQLFDAGEPVITSLNDVAFNSSTSILLAVTLETDYPSGGAIDVNLRANCAGSIATDEDNLARVNVLEGGVIGPIKTSVPASGSFVEPGEDITYSVSFSINQVTLNNVVVTDVLHPALGEPARLTVTVNSLTRPGVASYDPDTRTVTATLGTVNPADEVVLTIATGIRPTTPGAVTIDNTATMTFTGGSLTTAPVTHITPASCVVLIKPDGTLGSPAFLEAVLPGGRAVFPYTLTNAGNVVNDFLLETPLSNNDFVPTVSLVLDSNGNGILDAGETPITRVDDIASSDSVNLLLVIETPNDRTLSGTAFINVIGHCAGDLSITDDDNISQVTIPGGGIIGLQKSSDPAPESILYPSATVRYFIDFEANGRDLTNVSVGDVLDERLAAPSSFTSGEIRDEESGLTTTAIGTYDAASRQLRWNFASVPAGMNVRLEVVTAVRADVQFAASDFISNTAIFAADDIPELPTNTVTHPLNQLDILLSKVATPERVFVGDTLTYTLTIINPDGNITLNELILTDNLPNELRYKEGTARVTLPGQQEQALEPTTEGQKLTWRLPGIAPGERIVVTIGTDVLAAAAQTEELINIAEVVASDANGRAVADAAAEAATVIEKGLFTAPAVLLGTVFEDLNNNNLYDEDSDVPVAGVRVYLTDGRSVVSDDLGRYAFLELRAGIEVVKVDAITLPARLLSETKAEVRPGLWRVRLEEGLITRQDVPLLPPGARVAVTQSLNVVMGNVRVTKCVVVSESATTVVLTVSSREALSNLVVQDMLPSGVTASEAVSDNANAAIEGLTFNLGDVPSGYTATIEYNVEPREFIPTDLLLAPVITWQVRP
jgi:fimbrial isopeptide formation D2 family protein